MIEFFFDCSSPWTYLAFHNIQPLATEFGEDISWRPILVGGIFNTINPSVYASREKPVPVKQRYMLKDLGDWARSAGLAIFDKCRSCQAVHAAAVLKRNFVKLCI